jgi:HD-GYP domain-containing protein (c-di-GMP phosphodiesterase class II)
LAGLIHDIGKVGTPDFILQKESRLSEEEYAQMKKHSEDGYQIIQGIKSFGELGISDMVRYHHERPDGKGYPSGLKGTEIPIGARILGVADAFDAMTTNRSYRQKLPVEIAAEELTRYSGTQFDPKAAKALLTYLVREGKLERELSTFRIAQVSLAK